MLTTKPVSDQSLKEESPHSFIFKHGTSMAEIDERVWSSFRSGNRKALDYIYEKYIRILLTYGLKIVKDQAMVEDCIHDVFVELWRKHEILGDTDNIKLYLLKALRRRIARVTLENNRLPSDALDACSEDIQLDFSAEFYLIQTQSSLEHKSELKNALSQLSARQHEAVYLKFYEQLTYLEIASMMHLTVKSTYKLIGKALESLRNHIRV